MEHQPTKEWQKDSCSLVVRVTILGAGFPAGFPGPIQIPISSGQLTVVVGENPLLLEHMGVSENSVPLNPMVNDDYPY